MRGPRDADQPWKEAGAARFVDPRLQALSWAVLAPNPHNMQPWLIDLADEDRIDIYFQTDRGLPQTDPWDRQLTIGFGAFTELLVMGAAHAGYQAEVSPFPDGAPQPKLDGRRIVSIRLRAEQAQADPLFSAVLRRRTDRGNYALEPLGQDVGGAIAAELRNPAGFDLHDDEADVVALRDLAIRAFEIEMRTPLTWMESIDVMRIGRAEMDAEPWGLALRGPMIEFGRLVGAVSRESLADPAGAGFQTGLDMFNTAIASTPAFVSQVTPGNSRLDQFETGRDWLRLHLAATRLGLTLQPCSQALQEYAEQAEPYAEIHERLAPSGGTVQMFARIGRANAFRRRRAGRSKLG
ncbi:hypothetical protein [Maricaulis sp.]|uniref:Acg family FMN-binding oxidoreductase n=1 Tax=Maricaulis sp. TaxID=1486257 RepID=UPI002633009F|nr:hypothetical protein [Maricaulis sp.]